METARVSAISHSTLKIFIQIRRQHLKSCSDLGIRMDYKVFTSRTLEMTRRMEMVFCISQLRDLRWDVKVSQDSFKAVRIMVSGQYLYTGYFLGMTLFGWAVTNPLCRTSIECALGYPIKYMVDIAPTGTAKNYRWAVFSGENGVDVCRNTITYASDPRPSESVFPAKEFGPFDLQGLDLSCTWEPVGSLTVGSLSCVDGAGKTSKKTCVETPGGQGRGCQNGKNYESRVQCSWDR